ncbi:hypothetical protein [Deinococcus cellulosilyticus]|nr:hypothetical protein [Deinococcus cellulosilyticus]
MTNNSDQAFQLIESIFEYSYFSIDSGIQKEAIGYLGGLIKSIRELRNEFINENNEIRANECLDVIIYAYVCKRKLECILSLKKSNMHKAYDYLIDAQRSAEKGIEAGFQEDRYREKLNDLVKMENLLFPRQLWCSVGMINNEITCSICGLSVFDCLHISGQPYMGKLCYMKYNDVELEHIAVIPFGVPENKKCRTKYFVEGGYKIDCITKSVLGKTKDKDGTVKMLAMVTSELEY